MAVSIQVVIKTWSNVDQVRAAAKLKNQKLNSVIYLTIILLLLFMRETHEPWRDEVAHWAFTRHSGLLQISREYLEAGSFGYLVLFKCLTYLSLDFDMIARLVSIALAFTLLKFFYTSNLSLGTKLLFLNPLFATQYLIVTRDYTLIVILLILFFSLDSKKPRWQQSSFCLLAPMAFLGFWGFVFASMLLLMYRKDWSKPWKLYQSIILIAILILNITPIIYRVMSKDMEGIGTNLQIYGLVKSIDIFRWNLTSSIATPRNPATSELGLRILSNQNNLRILELISFLFIALILYCILKSNFDNFRNLLVVLVSIAFFLTFIYPGGTRHYAAIWLTLLIGFVKSRNYLEVPYRDCPMTGEKIVKVLAVSMATLQLIGYSSLLYADVTKKFSTTRQIEATKGNLAFFPAYLSYGYVTFNKLTTREVNKIYQLQGDYFGVPSEAKMKTNRIGNLYSRLCSKDERRFFLVTSSEFAKLFNLNEIGDTVQITEKALVSEEGSILKIEIKCSRIAQISSDIKESMRKN